jgi:hypothetical protein
MITPVIVILWLVCGIASGMIAQAKDAPFGYYFLWGVLFGPIGIIASLLAKPGAKKRVPPAAPAMGAPGWYVDPIDQRFVRYWDGMGWTDHLQQISPR